jgi:predicted transposase YbfD/YdcC
MVKAMPQAPPAPPGSLAAALAGVPDPRRPYGWRPDHAPVPLAALLQATVAAVLCGARSLYAVAQWIRERAEDEPELLEALGFPPGRSTCVATLRRVYKALEVTAFEQAVGTWLRGTGVAPDDPVALDGKPLRGVHGHVEHGEYVPGLHLVAAYAHRAQAVLAQLRTAGKGQELAAATQVLAQVPLAGRVVPGDALRTQREVCQQIVAAGGDYVFPVEENQPALRESLGRAFSPLAADRGGGAGATGPAAVVPGRAGAGAGRVRRGDGAGAQREPKRRHGRDEVRMLWALADPLVLRGAGAHGTVGAPWPHLRQVARLERRRAVYRRGQVHESAEVAYVITSLPPARAEARRLLGYIRGHWGIENRLHWVRDVTFDEDRPQVRTGAAPQLMAAARNLVLALLRRADHPNIAAALRTYAGRPANAVTLVLHGGRR